jgi:hypothetical protein
MSHMNPIRTLKPYFPQIHFNIILPFTHRPLEWSLSFRLSNKYFLRISRLPHARLMPRPSHPPWFNDPNNIWWRVQNMELCVMQFSPWSRHFIPLRSKYSSKHAVPIQPKSVLLLSFFPVWLAFYSALFEGRNFNSMYHSPYTHGCWTQTL